MPRGDVTWKAVALGFSFIIVGLIKTLADRWQSHLSVDGYPTRKAHAFEHVFFLWFVKQLMQMSLYFVWNLIDNNRLGMGRLRHGDVIQRVGGNRARLEPRNAENDVPQSEVQNVQDQDNRGAVNENRGPLGGEGAEEDIAQNENAAPGNDNNDVQPLLGRPRQPRPNKYTKLLYFPPAFFDVAHVLLLYFGVKLTYSSSFIMLKGTMGFFAALLSMSFLVQQLAVYVWFGVVLVTLGFGSLGIADYIHDQSRGYEKYGIVAGDLLILMSQIMFVTKLIYEEKFIRKHSIHPMHFLGSEGSYGFVFSAILLLIFNFANASQYSELPNGHVEDVRDAFWQFTGSWEVQLAVIGSLLSYIVYTYLGLLLVRDFGALPRIMIEMLIWGLFWAVSLGINWEQLFVSQAPGFVVILVGILVYSHILNIPFLLCHKSDQIIGQELNLGHQLDEEADDDGEDGEENVEREMGDFAGIWGAMNDNDGGVQDLGDQGHQDWGGAVGGVADDDDVMIEAGFPVDRRHEGPNNDVEDGIRHRQNDDQMIIP